MERSEGCSAEDQSHHFVVGMDFRAWDGHIYHCDGYDPRYGYWMTRKDAPNCPTVQEGESQWCRSVSERAIGSSFRHIQTP